MYRKHKPYLETSLCLLFNAAWLDPEKAGDCLADCAIEACKNIYVDSFEANGTMVRIRADWLRKFSRAFESKIKSQIGCEKEGE